MILAPQKNDFRGKTTCSCGNTAKRREGNSEFFIGPRKIIIKNIPHFYCSYCDKEIFDSTLGTEDLLKYAFKNNMNEVDWNEKSLYI